MYAKLFTSIYQGTLRGKSHPLLVFTNMLAHADAQGVVDIHPRAIAEEVGLSIEQVRQALDELEAPDAESRSPEAEGRRIVRTDGHRSWGWRVVNYVKYRSIRNEDDRKEQNRIAQQRWRDKQSSDGKESKPRKQLSAQAEEEEELKEDAKSKEEEKTNTPRKARAAPAAPSLFAEFWVAYPRKVGKPEALKAFAKLAVTQALLDNMLHALAWQRESDSWRKDGGQYIPHPSTWLHQERWNDEPVNVAPYETPKARAAREEAEKWAPRNQKEFSDAAIRRLDRLDHPQATHPLWVGVDGEMGEPPGR